MMLTPVAIALVESLQFGFITDRHTGCLPQGLAQVGRTTFAHVHVLRLELPTLMHAGTDASVSHQFFHTDA